MTRGQTMGQLALLQSFPAQDKMKMQALCSKSRKKKCHKGYYIKLFLYFPLALLTYYSGF